MEIQGLNLPFSVSLCVFSVDLCVIVNKELTQSSTEALGAEFIPQGGALRLHRVPQRFIRNYFDSTSFLIYNEDLKKHY